jgi:hypothetical protein
MKNIKNLLVILILINFSCKKVENDLESQNCTNNCVTISGYLTTSDSTKALENIDLDISYEETDGLGAFSLNRLKAQATTDKNGYYSMKFGLRDDELDTSAISSLELKVHLTEEYLFEEYTVNFHVESDIDLIWNYYFPYKSTLRIHKKGIENMQQGDRVLLTIETYTYPEYLNFYYNDSSGLYFWNIPAHQNLILKTKVYKNNAESSLVVDTVFLEKNDTLDYEVEYK